MLRDDIAHGAYSAESRQATRIIARPSNLDEDSAASASGFALEAPRAMRSAMAAMPLRAAAREQALSALAAASRSRLSRPRQAVPLQSELARAAPARLQQLQLLAHRMRLRARCHLSAWESTSRGVPS